MEFFKLSKRTLGRTSLSLIQLNHLGALMKTKGKIINFLLTTITTTSFLSLRKMIGLPLGLLFVCACTARTRIN